jgi:hypothetical protein
MSVQSLYLGLVIAAFGVFAVTLMTTHFWVLAGQRKPPKA